MAAHCWGRRRQCWPPSCSQWLQRGWTGDWWLTLARFPPPPPFPPSGRGGCGRHGRRHGGGARGGGGAAGGRRKEEGGGGGGDGGLSGRLRGGFPLPVPTECLSGGPLEGVRLRGPRPPVAALWGSVEKRNAAASEEKGGGPAPPFTSWRGPWPQWARPLNAPPPPVPPHPRPRLPCPMGTATGTHG